MTKIFYDDTKKKSVINGINTCISNINDINNILYNTFVPYDFYYKNTFNNIKKELIYGKNILIDYKNDINKYMENINKNELELGSRINKIEEVIIKKNDFY